jgi:GTP-binding protein HflX
MVHVELPEGYAVPASPDETLELATTAGVRVLDTVVQRRERPDARTFIGKGKLEEVIKLCEGAGAELIIFNQELSPGQAKAIAETTSLPVIDRTMLILDIFAQRAQTRDGKLQVELAQLRYRQPFLLHRNPAFSRLEGRIGGRGPGETKLEMDRRVIRDRIAVLEKMIEHVAAQRRQTRKRRTQRQVPVVSLVGYTNAGKSTLFNLLTGAQVRARNELFSTLDPTARRVRFPEERELVLTDTVGFIEHLPPALLAAFRATLEELHDADLLVHVVDMSSPRLKEHLAAVDETLKALELAEIPRILVFNKTDRVGKTERAEALARLHRAIPVCALEPPSTVPLVDAIRFQFWRASQPTGAGR